MKKTFIIILSIIVVITVCMTVGFILYKNYQEKKVQQEKYTQIKAQERYSQIRENVKKGVEWNIGAMYPGCSVTKKFNEESKIGTHYNSSFLINNGYIKKSELLDVDEKSYCDVYVKINSYYENPLDHQHNCEIYYKVYLKCKDYEDEGYINWGTY